MSEAPKTPQQWSKFYEQRAKKREAQRARDERAASKARKGKDVPHPLLTAPDAAHHERVAERAIAVRRAAEQARRSQPHPQARFAHIPVPPAPEAPRRSRRRQS